ncbi:hypothetical protein CYFUS_001764 [Cystobacter fuscus]|uniref:Uncharacterized protein n=1 Tax=Cystobacter fuscus TaxID=43 RepID=A0A250IYL1_9BACT|nr:hypothetical protein [Cystobacter fuscus]ATB36350.1 hypothetical protein CYFUS_001764 [Cystobacter fuscus]
MNHSESTFLAGCAPFHDYCFVAKALDELSAKGLNNSTFLCFVDGGVEKVPTSVGWAAVAAATVKPPGQQRAVVFIGAGRDVFEINPETLQQAEGELHQARHALAALTVVNHVVLACGMGREVLVRDGPAQWRAIGPGPRPDDHGVVGFEGLHGFSLDELYAVGWQGEVWRGDVQGRWARIDSPTSANLNAVCCAADGQVYAVGDGGMLVRGRGNLWETVDTGRGETLRDVADFGGEVFVVSDFRILRLRGDRLVPDDRFDSDARPGSCLRLLPAEDGLYSLGPKDLYLFRNGRWRSAI